MMKPYVALLFLFVLCCGMSRAQSRIIPDFPLLSQNSSLEDYPNDCGEWAVASILSYWNVNACFPYTAFDRFLGRKVDPNNPANRGMIAALTIDLQDVLGYIPNASTGSLGTNPFRIQDGISAFCNDEAFGNNYDFQVSAFSDSNPFNNDRIWEKVRFEIEQGRPVLFLIAGSISARTEYSGWTTYNLWHYMPIYGYNENLDGRRVFIAASLGSWNSTIYLDVESAYNTISSFPDLWTIIPHKDPSEGPEAVISAGIDIEGPEPAIGLHTEVVSASVIDHVEYEVSLQEYEWTGAGDSNQPESDYEKIYSTSEVEDAVHVWFRSRAIDYFGNHSEWSYACRYFTIRNSMPEEDQGSVPTRLENQISMQRLVAYPNPTSGKITLLMDGGQKGTLNTRVYDATGHCVHQVSGSAGVPSGRVELDLSLLPAGMYFLMIQHQNALWVGQVILK